MSSPAPDYRRKAMDEMTRMMLNGSTMTSLTCDRCKNVLLRSRSGELTCSYCKSLATAPLPTPPERPRSPQPPPPATVSPFRNASSLPSSDEASARLGRHLLAGWRMLADSCSNCNTPLMSPPRSEEVLCVVCGTAGAARSPPSVVPAPTALLRQAIAFAAAEEDKADEDEDGDSDDVTAATLASSPSWSAAFAEVERGALADAVGGPTARVLLEGRTAIRPMTPPGGAPPAIPDIRAPSPPSPRRVMESRVFDAPANWSSMTPEELRDYANSRGGVAAADVTAPSVTIPRLSSTQQMPPLAPQLHPQPTRIAPSLLVPGAPVSLSSDEGNIGPSGRVDFVGAGALNLPPPSPDLVARIEAGLARGELEAAEARATTRPTVTAAPAAAPATTTNAHPELPANTAEALQRLIDTLARENSTVIRLSREAEAGSNDAAELLATAASRLSRIVRAVGAMRSLYREE